MFTFRRTSHEPAEVWTIAIAAGSLPGAEARFGPAARANARNGEDEGPSHFHEIGVVIAFEQAHGETQFLLACKDGLSDDEKNTMRVELEMLLGREVYGWDNEEAAGWFLHDTLS